MMIDHCPRFGQRFFGSRTVCLSKPQQSHLWRIVLAMVVCRRPMGTRWEPLGGRKRRALRAQLEPYLLAT